MRQCSLSHFSLKLSNSYSQRPTSSTPPTPSTATSILSPRLTPPFGVPIKSTLMDSNNKGHASGPPTSFRFCTGSSRSNSVSQVSDTTESISPPFLYSISNSEEAASNHNGKAYDQREILHAHAPMYPTREEALHYSAMGHDLSRLTATKSPLGSDGFHNRMIGGQFAVGSIDLPFQAQVEHLQEI